MRSDNMVQGRDIPGHYPRLTENDLFEWCRTGRLRPFKKCGDPVGMDPKSPRGWRRVFPSREARDKYRLLCGMYGSLRSWLKSRRVPDEEVIETDRDRLALRLAKSGKAVELPEIEQFKYNLFRRRQRETAEISRLLSEVGELENELNQPGTWAEPPLIFSEVIGLLMDSFFRSEDIEKLLSSAGPGPVWPQSPRESEDREP